MDRDRGRNGAARCRRAAREAVADVEPVYLHDFVDSILDDASMAPGILALESAAAVAPEADAEAAAARAAAVQLVYEGLRRTRRLARDAPWEAPDAGSQALDSGRADDAVGDHAADEREADGQAADEYVADEYAADGDDEHSLPTDGGSEGDLRADLEIVAADILVARGFSMLSRSGAADKAVHTVRAFGRDQTQRHQRPAEGRDEPSGAVAAETDAPDADADPESLDANLERDVLELAVITGASVADEDDEPPETLLAAANDLVDAVGVDLPPADELVRWLDARTPERAAGDGTSGVSTPSDRATSATDP